MPTLHEATGRYIDCFLTIVEMADSLFLEEKTQGEGIDVFDDNKEQIDLALIRVLQQDPNNVSDVVLARFVDALSPIGMMRYSVTESLIPWTEQQILAARRLDWKDLEADSLDGLGILYAFLGHMRQAIQYFEMAYDIADQAGNKELRRAIRAHLTKAQKQSKKSHASPAGKFQTQVRLLSLRLRLLLAQSRNNPITQINLLNSIANTYALLERNDLSILFYQKAISMSRKRSFHFGELQASMGLLQARMSKETDGSESLSISRVGNLVNQMGFEWSTDFSVFETLLEIAPGIQNAEIIASHLANNNDPRADEIYRMLDNIMARTNEIVSSATEDSPKKHEIFSNALSGIKDELAGIVRISSEVQS